MRRLLVVLMAAATLGGGATVGVAAAPPAAIAKTCSPGYTHAVIGGHEKCLRRGEFCSWRYRNQYHRYGFDCVLFRSSGTYHLEPRG
jgi:hypothetical protein